MEEVSMNWDQNKDFVKRLKSQNQVHVSAPQACSERLKHHHTFDIDKLYHDN